MLLVVVDPVSFLKRNKGDGKWENKWHVEICDPSFWGRLNLSQTELLKKETQATTIGGDYN